MIKIVLVKVDENNDIKNVSLKLKKKYVGDYQINEYGKPISDRCFFNISHSKDVVVFTSNKDTPVGIDIEKVRPVDQKVVDYTCSNIEKAYIKSNKQYFEIWTNKEAIVKCEGTGFQGVVKTIPALPLNSVKSLDGEIFTTKTIDYKDYVITVCLKGDFDFEIELVEETI